MDKTIQLEVHGSLLRPRQHSYARLVYTSSLSHSPCRLGRRL